MAEATLFQEGTFQVTRRRVVVDDQQYALQDLTSVQIDTARLPRILVAFAVLVGTGALMGSQVNGSIIWLAASIILLALVGWLWWRANHTYILVLGTNKGEQRVFTSRDRQLIERAAQTIDALLVERGRR